MNTSETIDYLIVHGFDIKLLNLNFLMAGLVAALLSIKDLDVFNRLGVLSSLALLLMLIGFMWLFVKYILSYIYLLIGKLWKGKASYQEIMLVLSLAAIPEILYLSYILIVFTFTGEIKEVNYLIKLIGWIFSIRILLIGISKVQGFSFGLALVNVFLPPFLLSFMLYLWKTI